MIEIVEAAEVLSKQLLLAFTAIVPPVAPTVIVAVVASVEVMATSPVTIHS